MLLTVHFIQSYHTVAMSIDLKQVWAIFFVRCMILLTRELLKMSRKLSAKTYGVINVKCFAFH